MSKQKKSSQKTLKGVPAGAIGLVYGSNPLTKWWGWVESGRKDVPTHAFIYKGGGEQKVVEANFRIEENKFFKKYKNKRVEFFWFKDLTVLDIEEIKKRAAYLKDKKYFYDWKGYCWFVLRLIPGLNKIFKPSNKTVFCSDFVAVVYQGDKNNKDKNIKNWKRIKFISMKPTPNMTAPMDIRIAMLFHEEAGSIDVFKYNPKGSK